MAKIKFGEIEGIKEGDTFISRQEMTNKGLHRITVGGIDGNGVEGSASIVLNGGYQDKDSGDLIIYTGHGGYVNKKQVKDQSWDDSGNKGLLISEMHGLPVRVTRGYKHKSDFSPQKGYQYGGLYMVTSHDYEKGDHGFWVCLFQLKKVSTILSNSLDAIAQTDNYKTGETVRISSTILRIVRDTMLSREIKELYDYTCQVCGLRISFKGVGYAEAAHILPLGKPHNGKDLLSNLLCLCPNHHVMFDKGHFTINDRLELIGIEGSLHVHKTHKIDKSGIQHHYNRFITSIT